MDGTIQRQVIITISMTAKEAEVIKEFVRHAKDNVEEYFDKITRLALFNKLNELLSDNHD